MDTKSLLTPTDAQRRYFHKAAGCDRFVWNLALEEWNRRYAETGKTPNWMDMRKDFNEFKYEAFPWMKEVHRDARTDAFERLSEAWKKHFKNPNQAGRPTFHKKGRNDSFYVANEEMWVDGFSLKLPCIGMIRMTEELRYNGKIKGAVVSRTADRWFVSIQVSVQETMKPRSASAISGFDLGITSAATLSTGEKIKAPKPLKKALKKLKRLDRKQSRQNLGGKNRQKTNRKLARIHARIANIRKDFWHKTSTKLCRENQAIAIEDLNVAALIKSGRNARALGDVAVGMFRPMLEYKSKIYGNTIVKVDRWFPSSKMCSRCKHVKDDFDLYEHTFHCEKCGLVIDRDANAAINLKNQIPEAFGKSNACGLGQGTAPRETGTTMRRTPPQDAHVKITLRTLKKAAK